MMDDLVEAVSRAAQLSPDQATLAVGAMMRFLAARLPSPLVGELQSRLRAVPPAGPTGGSSGGRGGGA